MLGQTKRICWTVQMELDKIQRLVNIGITGAMRIYPTAAMEALFMSAVYGSEDQYF